MKARTVVLLTVLAVMVVSAASATTLGGVKSTVGSLTTYTYTFTSTEFEDLVTSVHIYAPLSPELIRGHTMPAHWTYDVIIDPDPEVGTDIYWYADEELYAIPNGGKGTFTLTVPSWTSTDTGHIVPGCFGNWGYETASWPGDVLVSFPSILVPAGVPEPASLIVLAAGCGLLARLRRRRSR
jgi:hypothetical protein